MSMKIISRANTKIAVVSLVGDPLGESDAQLLRDRIHGVVDGEIRHVVIDLAGVRHINSAGLGGLISAMCSMVRAGGKTYFAAPGTNVKEAFRITHLDQVFSTFETVEMAISACT